MYCACKRIDLLCRKQAKTPEPLIHMTISHKRPAPKPGIIASLDSFDGIDFKTIIGSVTRYDKPSKPDNAQPTPFSTGLSLHYWHLKPPENPDDPLDDQKPHFQDELYMILEGAGSVVVDGKEIDVKEGDIIFVPAQMPHHFESLKTESMRILIFFGPDWCGRNP